MKWFHIGLLAVFCLTPLHSQESKKALIFGIAGQDGVYLTEFLLEKNYEVHGAKKATTDTCELDKLEKRDTLFLYDVDVTNCKGVFALIDAIRPDEIYNLASQSQVSKSFHSPIQTTETNALGTLYILEAVRVLDKKKRIKFFQASTSELYGAAKEAPQTEETPFSPRSPYAVAKLYAHYMTVNYREGYGLFACNGILFNHESPLRKESFVTRKITKAACRHKKGLQDVLYLGNLNVRRDWGYAKDYVKAMWLTLQQEEPEDFVIATGQLHTLREFVELSFKELGIDVVWKGIGTEECGINRETGEVIVQVDTQFYRPNEVDITLGNPKKAKDLLHWKATTSFAELVKIMIEKDCQ